jgi:hypothetical protein
MADRGPVNKTASAVSSSNVRIAPACAGFYSVSRQLVSAKGYGAGHVGSIACPTEQSRRKWASRTLPSKTGV